MEEKELGMGLEEEELSYYNMMEVWRFEECELRIND